jgi:hypothetical protein
MKKFILLLAVLFCFSSQYYSSATVSQHPALEVQHPSFITGLSTDNKPTDIPTNSRFYETDTGIIYWYHPASGWIFDVGAGSGLSPVSGKLMIGNTTPAWSVLGYTIPLTVCTNGQVLKSDGTNLTCQTDATGGTPTFDAVASGINTSATMTVHTGAKIVPTGTGSIVATALSAQYVDWNQTSGATSIANKPTLFDRTAPGAIGGTTPAAATFTTVTATTFVGAHTGNSSTATALYANGANCSSGYAPLGVDASGAVEGCWQVTPTAIGALATAGTASNSSLLESHAASYFQTALTNPVTGTGTQYYIPYWTASGTQGALDALGTTGYVLTSRGSGTIPTWQAATGGGNVSNSGTPTIHQWPVFTTATAIKGTTVTASKVVCSDSNGEPVACTNLTDLAFSSYQPIDADLTTIAALSPATGKFIISSATPTWTLSAYTLPTTVCSNGEVLKSNGTNMTCQADSTGGSPTFDAIASGTNTSMTGTVGTGASLAPTGTGTIIATSLTGTSTIPNGVLATTQTAGDNSTKLATTAYANALVSDVAYDATTWDSIVAISPSKNAIRDYLESRIPSGSDGTYGLVMTNNTTRTPTVSTDELYFEANVLKFNQNGTEYSSVIGPTASQVTFTGLTSAHTYTMPDAATTLCGTNAVCTGYQASLTNPITGTGTQYYLPVWTATGTQGALAALGSAGNPLISGGAGTNPSFLSVVLAGGTNTWSVTNGSAALTMGAGKTWSISGTMTDGRLCTYTASGNVIACDTAAAGGGNVSNTGTPTQYQWPQWDSATVISGHTVTASKVVCSGTNSVPVACTNLTDVVPVSAPSGTAPVVVNNGVIGTSTNLNLDAIDFANLVSTGSTTISVYVPWAGTIVSSDIVCQATSTISAAIYTAPVNSDTWTLISSSAPVTLSNAMYKATNSTLSGWTTAFTAGKFFRAVFNEMTGGPCSIGIKVIKSN